MMSPVDKIYSILRSKKYLVGIILFSIMGAISIYVKISDAMYSFGNLAAILDQVAHISKIY